MLGQQLKHFACWFGCTGNCPGCQITRAWNLWRQFCHCGAAAMGYRARGADIAVEFFCSEHFQDVPAKEE